MRILIWGAGAIGGVIGAYLVRAGHEITFVDRAAAHVDAVIEPAGLGFQLFPTVVAQTSDSPVLTKAAA